MFLRDSDGQSDLQELEQLVAWADDYGMVMGYRAKRRDPLHRLINAWGWNMFVRRVLRLKLRDIHCAFRLFQRSVFNRIQIRSVGAMVNTEILAQAASLGMSMREIEVTHYPRHYGKPSGAKLRVIVKAFRELIRLWGDLRKMTDEQLSLYSEARDVAAAGSSLSWQINLILLMLPLKQRRGSRGALEVLLQCYTGESASPGTVLAPRPGGWTMPFLIERSIPIYIIS